MMIEIYAHQLTCHRYRAVQSIVRLPADAHDDLVCSFHSPCSSAMQQLCSLYSLHLNAPPTSAGKIMEDISAAPGVALAKALFKSAPSLIFGHGALSMLLARISKGGVPQVSVKGFLQQFVPAVAVLTPAILVPKITQIVAKASPTAATSATTPPPSTAPKATMVSSVAAKTSHSLASDSSSADSMPGLTRARATFRKLIRARRPSSVEVLRMLGVSTSLYPSALSAHEASGKSSLLHLLKTSSVSSMPLQLSGMWPTLKSILPCSVYDLRVIDAKFVPSAGALYTSVNRKVRVTFCNGTDSFFGSLATVSAKSHRGDDHSWDFPSAQVPTIKHVFTYLILTCTRRF